MAKVAARSSKENSGFDDIAVWRTIWQDQDHVVCRVYHTDRLVEFQDRAGQWQQGDIAQACSHLRPVARAETSLEVQRGKQAHPKKQPVVAQLAACPLRLTYWSNVRRPGGKGKLVSKRVWLLQVQNLFCAQGIEEDASKIYYAATGLEGPSLYWYLNKIQVAGDNAVFDNWNDFMVQLRAAFQPPNYQQHLRQQLKQLKQTGSVHEYGSQFRNIIGQILNMEELDKVSYFIDGLKVATKMEVNY